MQISERTRILSARAHAVRTSIGTSRETAASAALLSAVGDALEVWNAGKPNATSQQDWDRFDDILRRAYQTAKGEGTLADAEGWSDIINARRHAATTTPNQTTVGALMEAVERARPAVNDSRYPRIDRDELEDQIQAAETLIRQFEANSADFHVERDEDGNPVGTSEDNIFRKIGRWAWPKDKKLIWRPAFIIGVAAGVGALVRWRKADVKKLMKRLED